MQLVDVEQELVVDRNVLRPGYAGQGELQHGVGGAIVRGHELLAGIDRAWMLVGEDV